LESGQADDPRKDLMTSREQARLIGVSQSAVTRAFAPDSSISQPAGADRSDLGLL
jgi:hypothetical protein